MFSSPVRPAISVRPSSPSSSPGFAHSLIAIAQSIAGHLGLPAASIPAEKLEAHFGFLAALITLDNPTSTATTRRILGWQPTHPGLLADFDHGDYFL